MKFDLYPTDDEIDAHKLPYGRNSTAAATRAALREKLEKALGDLEPADMSPAEERLHEILVMMFEGGIV